MVRQNTRRNTRSAPASIWAGAEAGRTPFMQFLPLMPSAALNSMGQAYDLLRSVSSAFLLPQGGRRSYGVGGEMCTIGAASKPMEHPHGTIE